jgi:hypothetical protein
MNFILIWEIVLISRFECDIHRVWSIHRNNHTTTNKAKLDIQYWTEIWIWHLEQMATPPFGGWSTNWHKFTASRIFDCNRLCGLSILRHLCRTRAEHFFVCLFVEHAHGFYFDDSFLFPYNTSPTWASATNWSLFSLAEAVYKSQYCPPSIVFPSNAIFVQKQEIKRGRNVEARAK